jgi:hypothetical protein
MRKQARYGARVFPAAGGRPRQNSVVLDGLLPGVGFDHDGMPSIENLAALEAQALHRLNPRRALWPGLAEFEVRLEELEARQRETNERLAAANGGLRDADRRDAAASAAWEIDGRQGDRPAPVKPVLVERVASLELERDGLAGAIAEVLADKARFAARHRDRLVSVADRMVEQTRGRYLELVDELDATRAELVELREAALWASVFPDPSVSQMPKTTNLAFGATPPGLAGRPLAADGVIALLRADADAVAGGMSNAQRAAITGDDGRAGGAFWAADVTSTERQRETAALVEAARVEFGREPTEFEVEAFARERARGGV